MAFLNLQNYSDPPKRICGAPFGNILDAFPAKAIDPHSQMGYSFRIEPCNSVSGYSPDVCVTGVTKMDPDEFGAAGEAELRVVQAAFKCSTVGATDAELKMHARGPIERNLWRSVDQTLVDILSVEAVSVGGPFTALCVLSEAAQYLATNSFCGTGVIYGSTSWVSQVSEHLSKDGNRLRDVVGNLVIPSSIDSDTVYAFDSEVDIFASEIQLLDEYSPGIRMVNDRTVRAELVYTVALDSCATGSFSLSACGVLDVDVDGGGIDGGGA